MADFLENEAGKGYENVTSSDTSTPLLLIAQQLSGVVDEGKVQAGHFYNSVTGEDYGDTLEIVACHYQRLWYEWLPDQQGLAGIHEPNTIDVTGDTYNGMYTTSGNKVEEKMVFLVVLPEHLDAGYLILGSTPGSMKYYKAWLAQMQTQTLPSGKPAPLFGGIWSVTLNKDQSKKTGNKFYSPNENGKSSFRFVSWIDEELYNNKVKLARNQASIAYQKQEQSTIEYQKEGF